MEATGFNSQDTHFGLFTLGELETEENGSKMASWEFPTALPLLSKDLARSFDELTQVVGQGRYRNEDDYEDMCCNCRQYCD